MSLLRTIAKGAAWLTGAQWIVQLLQFAVSIVLARLLKPQDYGLLSMSTVFTGFVVLFGNLGLGPALIHKDKVDEDDVSTALCATIGIAVFLFIISYLCAPLVGAFYIEPRLGWIIRVASLGFLMSPLNSILTSLLTRRMAFKALAITEILCAIASLTTALVAAFLGFGVWSLVFGSLANHAVRMPILFSLSQWRPRLRFCRNRLVSLFSFGGYLLGFNFLNYFTRNLDNVIIGKFLGATALGYYDLAYQIMLKPVTNISHVISQPLFPALSSIKNDKAKTSETYNSIVIYISIITFPMMLGLAVVAPEFILGVLGEKWKPSIIALQILCIIGAMQSIATTVGDIFQSQGRTDILFKIGLFTAPYAGLLFLIGVQWNIEGVAMSYLFFTLTIWIAGQTIANKLINLSPLHFWNSLIPAIKSSAVMAICVLISKLILKPLNLPQLTTLVILVFIGTAIYSMMLYMEKADEITKVRSYLKTKFFRIDSI